MIPPTVTIAGWTGGEHGPNGPSVDEHRRRLWNQLDTEHPGLRQRYHAGDPEAARTFREVGMDHLHGYFIATAHRNAAPLANEYADLTTEALRAVHQAANDYTDLSQNTTLHWLAAHPRFVPSTLHARTLLERCIQIAEDLHQHKQFIAGDDLSQQIYARHVPAEHRITFPDLDQLRLELGAFIELSTERFAVTRVTVTGGYPAGFEPAPLDIEPVTRTDSDTAAWANPTFTTTPAVAATERRW